MTGQQTTTAAFIVSALRRAYPHPAQLRAFLATIGLKYQFGPVMALYQGLAADLIAASPDWRWHVVLRLCIDRSLFSLDWLAVAQRLSEHELQLADFRFGIAEGLDQLWDQVGGYADTIIGNEVDPQILIEICSHRTWIEEHPLKGSPEEQIQQFRGWLRNFQQLVLQGIVQVYSKGDYRTVDRVIAEKPVYYCSFSRVDVWLDVHPGPAGRAEIAELSANFSRLKADVYRMLWVTPEELQSGDARRAAFFVWILSLEAACNDQAVSDARWHLVDPRHPEPRPFAIVRDEHGQRRLGKRRHLLTAGKQQGRSCPHLNSAFQSAGPIEALLQSE